MRVFVTGGSGYIGRIIIERLIDNGHEVIALNHSGSKRSFQFALFSDKIRLVDGDIQNSGTLKVLMKNAEAVIHLVGIIRENKRQLITMDRIHVEGTKNVLAAAQACGVRRFLHMSALGARPNAGTAYHRTKWEAELYVRSANIPFTIFRPSVIFGAGGPGPNFLSELLPIIRNSPFIPIFGDGEYLLQPVSIETVAQAFVQALTSKAAEDQIYELGGVEVLSFKDIMKQLAFAYQRPFRPIYIPRKWAAMAVRLFQHVPGFPMTYDQLTMLLEGNTCNDPDFVYHALNLEPKPFRID